MEENDHELVARLRDEKTGLNGWIAIHSTKLGPATGGTRYLAYRTPDDALQDALQLSRAMTYKCALAGVPFGGGKAVIMANPDADRPALFHSYGARINQLGGRFSTGEDVGRTADDIRLLAGLSPHINHSGDPSPWAALGVFHAIRAALVETEGTDNLRGKRVAIKGLGKVGHSLAKNLTKEGAMVIGADSDPSRVALAQKEIPSINIVLPEEIQHAAADVYAPCALGNEFTNENIAHLNAKIICGAANNQLSSDEVGTHMHEAGILYVPDYLANAGGLINVVEKQSKAHVIEKVTNIFNTARYIIHRSREEHLPTHVVANSRVKEILMHA
jgi:leucine dehydrogenase